METQKIQEFECANITRRDGDRVYCYRIQNWISISSCTCSAETRSQEASMEW
jgi:hypothetical protein